MESEQPMIDALAKLELSMRPQSVPSWLGSGSNHAPKVPALGPRRTNVEYIDATKASGGDKLGVATTGPPAASVRPRAPIGLHKDSLGGDDREFLAKESVYASPKRSRSRARNTTVSDQKSRRVKQSLMESLRSLEFFDKTNRSRELTAKSSVMRTQADPEGLYEYIGLSYA